MNKTGASGNQDSVIYTSAAGVKENDIADWLGFGSASRQRAYDYHMATHGYQYAVEDKREKERQTDTVTGLLSLGLNTSSLDRIPPVLV